MQIIDQYQIGSFNPSTVGDEGTTVKCFPNPFATSLYQRQGYVPPNLRPLSSQRSSAVFSTGIFPYLTGVNINSNTVGQLNVPAALNGQEFHVLATGNFEVGSGGTKPTFSIGVYVNTGAVNIDSGSSPIITQIVSTTPFSAASTNTLFPWWLDVTLQGDSQSGLLQGTYEGGIGGTAISGNTTLVGSSYEGVDFSPNTVPPTLMGIVGGVTFGTSNKGNLANCFQFALAA